MKPLPLMITCVPPVTGPLFGVTEVITEALRQHKVSRPAFEIVMTPRLERLLDEGMEHLNEAVTTDELRRG